MPLGGVQAKVAHAELLKAHLGLVGFDTKRLRCKIDLIDGLHCQMCRDWVGTFPGELRRGSLERAKAFLTSVPPCK